MVTTRSESSMTTAAPPRSAPSMAAVWASSGASARSAVTDPTARATASGTAPAPAGAAGTGSGVRFAIRRPGRWPLTLPSSAMLSRPSRSSPRRL